MQDGDDLVAIFCGVEGDAAGFIVGELFGGEDRGTGGGWGARIGERNILQSNSFDPQTGTRRSVVLDRRNLETRHRRDHREAVERVQVEVPWRVELIEFSR